MRRLALTAALTLAACADAADDGARVFVDDGPAPARPVTLEPVPAAHGARKHLHLSAPDRELERAARAAAERIMAASGLNVLVNAPGSMLDGVPVLWSDAGEWSGSCDGRSDVMAIGVDAPLGNLLLHELLDALAGRDGPHEVRASRGAAKITAADLEALCSVAPCSTFQPEG